MSFTKRLLKIHTNHHAILFGARNTGKTTLLQHKFTKENTLWIDLLTPQLEERYASDPGTLTSEVSALDDHVKHVVIDEIQKVPRLLDVIHQLIESTDKIYIMTGSSARKLRHGGANLLAGRAFVYYLYPFTSFEIGDQFNLDDALHWGTLPAITKMKNDEKKMLFLQTYAQVYLKEEIWLEQFIRKLDLFRKFLEVSSQCNGKIINYSNIARDVGIDTKTVSQYFTILEDTLVGFFLEAFQHSFRKRLSSKPKFYYFDLGVSRALSRQLSTSLTPSTSAYGEAFEHFVILEIKRLAQYYCTEYRFSYLKTKDDAEIDLVVERPGQPILFIEIKSSINVKAPDLTTLIRLSKDFGNCEAICLSRDVHKKRFDNITIYPWQVGIKKYFMNENTNTPIEARPRSTNPRDR